ncbi:MAG TPA: hypothetical protein DCE41_14350 [Cytophagales bacterium]|nr:hypothetical protein [Cytophagales bacterium]HAA20457.1 hypothetical protein [Cytophagales bacterium]HAP64689.1 hypothetical protein [Cytophagales bacterium]
MDTLEPEISSHEESLVMPEGVLVFEDGQAMANAIEAVKEGSFSPQKFAQESENFTSLYQVFVKAKAQAEAIMAPLMAIPESELEKHEAEIAKAEKALQQLVLAYQDKVVFDGYQPVSLKFQDELLVHLLNPEGLVVVGSSLLRYEDGSFYHTQLSPQYDAKAVLLGNGDQELVGSVTWLDAKKGLANRDDVVAQEGCSTGDASTLLDTYVRVTNTVLPVTERQRYWVEPYCEDEADVDCGPTEDCDIPCYDGYWAYRTVVVGYETTNTRIYAELKTRKIKCFLFWCNTSDNKVNHELRVTGMGLNEFSSGFTATSTITVDLATPAVHGSVTLDAYTPLYAGFTCIRTASW